ncbi:hypothetical protein MTO96_035969 [Rhipicephalus appendiculatus]
MCLAWAPFFGKLTQLIRKGERIRLAPSEPDYVRSRPFLTVFVPCHAADALRLSRDARLRNPPQHTAAFRAAPAADTARLSLPPPKLFATLQAAEVKYQVAGESTAPALLETDSRWIRAMKAHRAAAAGQPITSTPPASTLSMTPTLPSNNTPHYYHSSWSRFHTSIPSGGLQYCLQTARGGLTSALELTAPCAKPLHSCHHQLRQHPHR